ncbi:MAG: NAD(P)H-hydrate dehydratase, partial [Candidatus Omnitrophica bacterium]|nr:NAD(P)H-hydrate dehydratase [Candidatus Omnitrophota bacterium]
GALRSGAGLVTLAVPEKIYSVVARREAEIMVRALPSTPQGTLSSRAFEALTALLRNQDVLAMGPGLSRNPATVKLVHRLVKSAKCAVVLDADALNAFEGRAEVLKVLKGRAVLTPHAGEYARLFGRKPAETGSGRVKDACAAAKLTGACVVLKGFQTVVAHPVGTFFVNTTGNPGMATAGSGDVLTGIVAGILAQGVSLYDAARFAVYFHGLAGDLAARKHGQISLTASDILEFLPAAFKKVF